MKAILPFLLSLAAVALAGGGCASRPPTGMSMTPPNLSLPPPQVIVGPMPNMRPPTPRPIDPGWLDLDGFYPPGAKAILPDDPRTPRVQAERRMLFPTAEECVSPDGRFTLAHDGMKRGRTIFHWLMLTEKNAVVPAAIFCTKLAFDVSWAEDSRHFAVTHYLGQNASEVSVVESQPIERWTLEPRRILGPYFPAGLLTAPLMLKAYRWTEDGQLVVRGVGRAEAEPYERFGCEVLVDCRDPGIEPRLIFLRGYIAP